MADPFKGLHVGEAEVAALLGRAPGAALLAADDPDPAAAATAGAPSPLAWLQRRFDVSAFDLDVIVVALAPELDLRYERIYAFLQNDVTRRRAGVELALNLLCRSSEEKLVRRARFAPDAPLLRHRLIELVADPYQARPPLLAQIIRLDEQIVGTLLGETGIDARIAHCAEWCVPASLVDDLPVDDDARRALLAVARRAGTSGHPVHLYLEGPFASEHRRAAGALATGIGAPLLIVDLARALSREDGARALPIAFRQAWLRNAVLYLESLDTLRGDDRRLDRHALLSGLAQQPGVTILSGSRPWMTAASDPSVCVLAVPIGIPAVAARRRHWRATLDAAAIPLANNDLDALAARFRLSPRQIEDAVETARQHVRWSGSAPDPASTAAPEPQPRPADLFAAARRQSRHDLALLASRIEPKHRWDDIVLPADALAQLREICARESHRHRVLDTWGFDHKLSSGKGVNALFAGPSGTGKTMAAEILASELQLDLYRIDLAGVVSKYIGETEKNLDRIFSAVENAVLFFDEADALFGKRSEVRDSHDRYANLEISYLLQKMEQYEGVAILATNLRQNLDDAFMRRLAFTVHFPFPDVSHRRHIWRQIWPADLPVAPDVDVEFLATHFKLSGGHIKNIALASAFLAAADGGVVTMDHVRHATQREYQKLGKTLSAPELWGATHEVGV